MCGYKIYIGRTSECGKEGSSKHNEESSNRITGKISITHMLQEVSKGTSLKDFLNLTSCMMLQKIENLPWDPFDQCKYCFQKSNT